MGGSSPRGRSAPPPCGALLWALWLLALAASACPAGCRCAARSGVLVQCAARGLRRVPPDLPADAVVLLLSSNRITSIARESFAALGRLRELDLSHNAIESVEAGAFGGLAGSLRLLDLSHNRLGAVPQDAFARLSARVRLAHNPWHCGCSLQEALSGLRLDADTADDVRCATAAREEHAGGAVVRLLDSGANFCNFHHKTTDVAMFVVLFCWFSSVAAYVGFYIRRNQEDARRHVEYLKSLPSSAHIGKGEDTASSVF
ncbi:Leucine-rich repeat-containing protein 3 [Liparis tanakae]|uniref:Leucine-rich repeat-containing protein 3 n=1 Tax=Liparis tanakae TaxID=230148 RepID=A0A4Z2EX70_9TELE|nr:Leucine-rich repeat-containing protein 3 [Liparis tanakae]